ncbi:MFS transporter [Chloroflexota bacterium]
MSQDTTSQSSNVKQKLFYGYIIVLISFLAMAINAGSRGAFGVFLKPMLEDIGSTRGLISGAFSLSQLVNACFSILAGRLSDEFGPRIVITFCGLFMGIGYLLMSQTTTLWQMYLFYGALIGVGTTFYTPIMSTVAKWFSTRRNTMIGIVSAGGSIGTMILPLFASWLITSYDWHISFAVLGSIILAVLIISAQFLKKDPTKSGQQAYGDDTKTEIGSHLQSEDISLKQAILTRQFWLLTLVYFLFGFGGFTLTVHIVPYATDQGISATSAASIVSVIGGIGIVSRLVMGGIGDKFGERRVFLIGFIFRLVAVLWLMSAKELWMLYLFAIGFGFSFGLGAQIVPWIAKVFGTRSLGAISGACTVGWYIGVALGPFIAGYIYDSTQSYQWAFLTIAIITLLGIVISRLIPAIVIKQKNA